MAQASRLWDALATGTLPDPTGLDPALVETIRQLHALGAHARPDPRFAHDLEEVLMQTMPIGSAVPLPLGLTLTTVSNGARPVSSLPGSPLPRPARSRLFLAQLATAALVLLTLLSSFVVFGEPLRQR